MRSVRFYIPVILLTIVLITPSCKKYLDKKPSDDLKTPSSITGLQGLLDNSTVINIFPGSAELLCDDYYLLPSDWTALSSQLPYGPTQKDLYIWQRDDSTDIFWSNVYQNILTTNIVLDGLPHIQYDPVQTADYNNAKGSALFLRAFYFYHLAQSFAKPYNQNTAATDLGIVLRLTSDISEGSARASVEQTYRQIIQDLKSTIPLLPVTPLLKTRPSLPAVYGALARTYLSMKEYDSAGRYADLCLSLHNSLMNYDTLNAASNNPISKNNPEVIFAARTTAIITYAGSRAKIDSTLYNSYSDNDLRKKVFFKANTGSNAGTYSFKGDYDGIGNPTMIFFSFVGIVTDEMYLIKAEANARKNNITVAMDALNTLLQTRYVTGTFTPLTATNVNEALTIIFLERRKELLRRGARWTDIRRLIDDDLFRILPKRILNTQTYKMTENNTPYIMLLPNAVIDLGGVLQN